MPRPPLLGYLQSAVADNTAHSQMDKLLFEDELENQPQYSMRAPDYGTNIFGQKIDEPWNMEKAISEGDFMPVGAGVKLFRGVPKWYRGQMVKGGKYISPLDSRYSREVVLNLPKGGFKIHRPEGLWASKSKRYAEAMTHPLEGGSSGGKGVVLEFDVPQEWWEKSSKPFRNYYTRNIKGKSTAPDDFYLGGIPKEYLKKVHKGYQEGGPAERAPLLGYMNPAIQDETAHSQMDNIIEENTMLGHVTGLLSNLGVMDEPIKHAADIPPLSETGKITDENLRDAFKIAQSAFSLESVGGPKGAGALIPAGSKKIKGILSQLNMSNIVGTQSSRRGMVEALKRQRAFEQGALPKKEMEWMLEMQSKLGFTPKYKDAPQRAIEDIVIKLHNLEIPRKSVEMAGKARLSLDKILERIMKQYNKTGMVSPSNEKAAWESFRALEEVIK
jgi:hypothetical protein